MHGMAWRLRTRAAMRMRGLVVALLFVASQARAVPLDPAHEKSREAVQPLPSLPTRMVLELAGAFAVTALTAGTVAVFALATDLKTIDDDTCDDCDYGNFSPRVSPWFVISLPI